MFTNRAARAGRGHPLPMLDEMQPRRAAIGNAWFESAYGAAAVSRGVSTLHARVRAPRRPSYGCNDPTYAARLTISSSSSFATTCFISATALPLLTPFLILYN